MSVKTRKVGIVTLHGYSNYGNRLQNFALQQKIKELGYDVDTLVFSKMGNTTTATQSKFQKAKRVSQLSYKEIVERIKGKLLRNRKNLIHYLNRRFIAERTNIFKEFSSEYLSERFFENSEEVSEKVADYYDYLVTGSDQVWNPNYIKGLENVYYLTFTRKEKRVSYAASFGIENLPEAYVEIIKAWLSEMKAVSVREGSGAEIVKRLTGKNAEVLLDPTLLLSKEQWLSIAREARGKPKQKYIISYFLGGKNQATIDLINAVSKKTNSRVVSLSDIKDKDAYKTGPREFIDYIHSAEAVFTDSFHGVIFSILMETPFVACKRLGGLLMYSRIETLLGILDLEKREQSKIKQPEEVLDMDLSHVCSLLQSEREKAERFLKYALL